MLGGLMTASRSPEPIDVAAWWQKVGKIASEVEESQEFKDKIAELRKNDPNNSDLKEFEAAKKIYAQMAEMGGGQDAVKAAAEADQKTGLVFISALKKLKGIKEGIAGKYKEFSDKENEQQEIKGPLTLALAKKFVELQGKFNAEGIKMPSSTVVQGKLKKDAFPKVVERHGRLKDAVEQYERVELRKVSEEKKIQAVAAAPMPSNIPPPPSSSAPTSKPKQSTTEFFDRFKASPKTKTPDQKNEDIYLRALEGELELVTKTKKSIDLKIPGAQDFAMELSALEVKINDEMEHRKNLLVNSLPAEQLDPKQRGFINECDQQRKDSKEKYDKHVEKLGLQKELYTSLKDIIKDHKAWSHRVEYKKFGGGRSIVDAKGGTDKVPTGIESMMQCLSVGAEAFQKKESSKFERFKRPFYTPIDIKDIDKRPDLDDKAIVADIKQLAEIAKNRLAAKSDKDDHTLVSQFYSSVMSIKEEHLADPKMLKELITEINRHHENLKTAMPSPTAPVDKKLV